MRKLGIFIAAIGLATFALPASAAEPMFDSDFTVGPEDGNRSAECPGLVCWDTGMFDEYDPIQQGATATAASVGCFVNAENPQGFPQEWRQGADDFLGCGSPITGIKIWGRYNQEGYESTSRVEGFCVAFYVAVDPVYCPDAIGSVPGDEAIGTRVYDAYVGAGDFTEEEVFGGLIRNFAYCINLDVPFLNDSGVAYWVAVHADYDLIDANPNIAGNTQWFWRVVDDGIQYDPFCEASRRYPNAPDPPPNEWVGVSSGVPSWAGYDFSLKLYSNVQTPTGACCFADGTCIVMTQDECANAQGEYQGDGSNCNPPNPCEPPVPTEKTTWGKIKESYR